MYESSKHVFELIENLWPDQRKPLLGILVLDQIT